MLEDVLLVWANCRAFNKPGTFIWVACDEAQETFRQLWSKAGLPGVPDAPAAQVGNRVIIYEQTGECREIGRLS